MTRFRIVVLAAAFTLAVTGTNVWLVRGSVPSEVIGQAIPRTVILMLLVKSGDTLKVLSHCSGSIVSPTGFILTASHCVRAVNDNPQLGFRKGDLYNPEGKAAVGLNLPGQDRPVLTLLATYAADDPATDLALLKPFGLLGRDGANPLPPDLRLPYLRIGDSDTTRHGDPVALIGFPAAGEDTVSVNQGFVSGFIVDDQNRRIRLKYDAVGGGGASGGPVINLRGDQIAVHTGGFPAGGTYQLRGTLTNRIPAAWLQTIRGATEGSQVSSGVTTVRPATIVFQGRVVDAQSGAGVQGATFYVLKPGAPYRTPPGADVLAQGVSDASGLFQTKPAVGRGMTYPVVLVASGYQEARGSLEVLPESPDVYALKPISLVRR